MSNAKPAVTLDSMYQRVATMMDNLAEGTLAPERADRIVKGAERVAHFAEIEMRMMDLAWSHDRDICPSGMMRALVDEDQKPRLLARPKAIERGR